MKTPPSPARSQQRHEKASLVVVAALIESHGRILACQRRKNDAFGLKWEFPGGKLKADESHPKPCARELREELGVDAQIGPEIYRTRHRYAELAREIELIFFAALADESANPKSSLRTNAVGPPRRATHAGFPASRPRIRRQARKSPPNSSALCSAGLQPASSSPQLQPSHSSRPPPLPPPAISPHIPIRGIFLAKVLVSPTR